MVFVLVFLGVGGLWINEFHERLLNTLISTMLIRKKDYKLTVSLTIVLMTSERFISKKIVVAITAVPRP